MDFNIVKQHTLYDDVESASGELSLSWSSICKDNVRGVAEALKVNTTVTKLDMSWNYLENAGARRFAEGLKVNTAVTELILCQNSIDGAGAEAIALALKVNTGVIQLDLSHNKIGDAGLQAIAEALLVNTTVRDLCLSSNQISDVGARAIAETLKVNTTLTRLIMNDNQIGDIGALAIAEALQKNEALNVLEVLVHLVKFDISSVTLRDKEPMILNIWDFAGQELDLASHQFFLDEWTIYLALFDVRDTISRTSRLAFWLRSLLARVPNAAVTLVGTHIDDKSYTPQRQHEQRENLHDLLGFLREAHRSFSIHSIVYMNASAAANAPIMPELKASMLLAGRDLPFYNSYVDGRYPQFQDVLRDRATKLEAEKKPPLLRWSDVVELGGERCGLSPIGVDNFMRLLRGLGRVVFHRTAQADDAASVAKPSLPLSAHDQDLVIINPQWFMKTVFGGVITLKHEWAKTGILARADLLEHVWKTLDPAVCDQLLVLLERYELLYPLADAGTPAARYLVPSLLPVGQPDSNVWSPKLDESEQHEATLVMRTAFMPTGFFSRVIARLHQLKFNMTAWRDCVLVSRSHHRALVQIHPRAQEDVLDLVIAVRGASPGALLDVLVGIVEDLTAHWYTGVTWQTYLRCTQCAVDVPDPCLFDVHFTVLAAVLPNKELSCDRSQQILVRDEWLAFIQPLLQRSLLPVEEPTELQRQALDILSPSSRPVDAPILPESHASTMDLMPAPSIATTIPRVEVQQLFQATGNFADSQRIGGGSFGSVYSGIWGGEKVAVKRLAADSLQGVAQFKAELEALSRYRHRNIVTIMCYAQEGNECCLVYELMANGSVRDSLDQKHGAPTLNWTQRASIAIDIARAMHFVQTAVPGQPLFHLDLKTSSVLLNEHFQAKVAGFGLARSPPAETATQSYLQTQTIRVTRPYICPQYRDEGKVSIKTDVYSYGMVLLELLTGKQPGIELAGAGKRALKKDGHLDSELDGSIIWSAPDKLSVTVVTNLALNCLESNQVNRPTFGDILKAMGQSVDRRSAHVHAAMPQNPRMEHHHSSVKEQSHPNLDSGFVSSFMEQQKQQPQSQLVELGAAAAVSPLTHHHSVVKEQLSPFANSIVVNASMQSQLDSWNGSQINSAFHSDFID
ncbi:hypothetical protein CAOG_07542 [Capsaspora owczarzaki ATCC 30864]|uniref:non-specific serine/threonine protein kinase n=1 Tax=Capsaspora owczarzaki (strain ATCC 30864) TaxID=595528 RepID=A0A0D2WVY9_CAPO3|nr:hypothetical protein CAOG_07542 [Capsaspora owczarzaki ATCC 30864]KJE97060.1 TKL/IRAK protein kinase [Capsaspora owczarzaki ATCC 30864]|eukprot:XP_004343416.1 hypothetical protein CAOG_07542 [Capsaspora owczarzaki ATCC 30864]